MVVVLTEDGINLTLSAATASELGRLGITNVTLVRGGDTTGVVLEGWAFDPVAAAEAVSVLREAPGTSRTLYPVAHAAVAAGTTT